MSSKKRQKKKRPSQVITRSNLKGNCRGCGKYGYKQVNCPKSKGGDTSPSAKNIRWRGTSKPFTCNYYKEPGHFVKDCPKLKKKNEKEKANVATEKKVKDDEKFDELYIDEIGLQCKAEEVKQKVQCDDKVEYVLLRRAKLNKKSV